MAKLPESVRLSASAVTLFRLHVERQGNVKLDDSNRDAYRELESAGLMLLSRPFVGERVYRLTRNGFERKAELLAQSESTSPSPGLKSSTQR
jgi:hypothetical protein